MTIVIDLMRHDMFKRYRFQTGRLFWAVCLVLYMMLILSPYMDNLSLESQWITVMIGIYCALRFMICKSPEPFPDDRIESYIRIDIPVSEKARDHVQSLEKRSKRPVAVTVIGLIDDEMIEYGQQSKTRAMGDQGQTQRDI